MIAALDRVAVTGRVAGGGWLITWALGFGLFFLSGIIVPASLATSALPLPNASADEARTWFAENQIAAVTTGVLQILSVICLAAFITQLKRVTSLPDMNAAARRASGWGFFAVALMVLSSVLAWVLAAAAPTASAETVAILRTGNFISGGTAHVLALGIFALLASRIPTMTKPISILAYIAAVPAALSLSSLFFVQGGAFILAGRVLCMIWIIISAAVSVARGRSSETLEVDGTPSYTGAQVNVTGHRSGDHRERASRKGP